MIWRYPHFRKPPYNTIWFAKHFFSLAPQLSLLRHWKAGHAVRALQAYSVVTGGGSQQEPQFLLNLLGDVCPEMGDYMFSIHIEKWDSWVFSLALKISLVFKGGARNWDWRGLKGLKLTIVFSWTNGYPKIPWFIIFPVPVKCVINWSYTRFSDSPTRPKIVWLRLHIQISCCWLCMDAHISIYQLCMYIYIYICIYIYMLYIYMYMYMYMCVCIQYQLYVYICIYSNIFNNCHKPA